MPDRRLRHWRGWFCLLVCTAAGLFAACSKSNKPGPDVDPSPAVENLSEKVHEFCGACHAYPPPSSFPRWAWKKEVEQGYGFFEKSGRPLQPPPLAAVVKYYEERAPEELPPAKIAYASTPCPVRFEKIDTPRHERLDSPAISNVQLVHLTDPKRLDILACDMRAGLILLLRPYEANPTWRVLAEVPNPAHVEVVDLDGDKIKDLLVANLGNFQPTDRRCGSVV